ncbi:NDR1/HIN1-like protein 1 [Linum grandiflorum]
MAYPMSVTIPDAPAAVPTNNRSFFLKLSDCILFFTITVLFILMATSIIISCLHHPTIFHLEDATFHAFNLTNSTNGRLLLTTSLRVNISSLDPNRHLHMDYVSMWTYASYRGHRITPDADLHRDYLRSKKAVEWSSTVLLSGENVQLTPELVGRDLSDGVYPVEIIVYGKRRFKLWTWFMRLWNDRLDVSCPVIYLMTSGGIGGMVNGGGRVLYGVANNHSCDVQE